MRSPITSIPGVSTEAAERAVTFRFWAVWFRKAMCGRCFASVPRYAIEHHAVWHTITDCPSGMRLDAGTHAAFCDVYVMPPGMPGPRTWRTRWQTTSTGPR